MGEGEGYEVEGYEVEEGRGTIEAVGLDSAMVGVGMATVSRGKF